MTDNTQPEAGSTYIIRYALELGLLWIDGDGRDKVREALDALDTLEAQLASIGAGGVSALMGAAKAGSEPVATVFTMEALTPGGGVKYHATIHKPLPAGTKLYAAPQPALSAGWRPIETAPKDGTYLLLWEQYSTNPFVGCWAFGAWTVSHEHVDAEGGWDGANVVDALSMPITHWMPIPAPPTSAEGVEHG